jgi:hypothetical protein
VVRILSRHERCAQFDSAKGYHFMPLTGEAKREYERERKRLWRIKAHGLLGGKCIICDSTDNLEFHHKDPKLKRFNLARAYSRRWESQIEEILTCELRCDNCHKLAHAAIHGSFRKYANGCRCSECVSFFRDKNRARMAKYRSEGRDSTRKNYIHPCSSMIEQELDRRQT